MRNKHRLSNIVIKRTIIIVIILQTSSLSKTKIIKMEMHAWRDGTIDWFDETGETIQIHAIKCIEIEGNDLIISSRYSDFERTLIAYSRAWYDFLHFLSVFYFREGDITSEVKDAIVRGIRKQKRREKHREEHPQAKRRKVDNKS